VAVVLTANHYLVDAVTGAALTVTCWFGVRRYHRRRRPRPSGLPATVTALPVPAQRQAPAARATAQAGAPERVAA